MKTDLHPTWYPEAVVTCACGNSWTTGATQAAIRTDICSRCHPFYTGEQRIVDTEGQVDRFIKRLQVRDARLAAAASKVESAKPENLALADLGLNKRHLNILAENGVSTAGEFIARLEQGGDQAILDIDGIGQKVLADVKRELRNRDYALPGSDAE
jgi:large subunit ribosomal protein L31